MENSWEDWHLHSELDCVDDYFTDNCVNNTDDGEEFLREILQLQTLPPAFSSESESDYSLQMQNNHVSGINDVVLASLDLDHEKQGNLVKSHSSNSIVSIQQQTQEGSKTTRRFSSSSSSSPKTYILSFDNSTMIPAIPETETKRDSSSKRNRCETQKAETRKSTVKKARSSSQTTDHIMAERKRRQELTERFIALSATIPGLSKTDKASILRAAIDYVKELKERVEELEKEDKKDVGSSSLILINKKTHVFGKNNNEESTISYETNCDDDDDDDGCDINILPEVDGRVMGKEVLFEINCEQENGIELKLLNHLENLQLFVTGSSVLPFGNSALSITIIAKMGDECKMTLNDLVKSLKQLLL